MSAFLLPLLALSIFATMIVIAKRDDEFDDEQMRAFVSPQFRAQRRVMKLLYAAIAIVLLASGVAASMTTSVAWMLMLLVPSAYIVMGTVVVGLARQRLTISNKVNSDPLLYLTYLVVIWPRWSQQLLRPTTA